MMGDNERYLYKMKKKLSEDDVDSVSLVINNAFITLVVNILLIKWTRNICNCLCDEYLYNFIQYSRKRAMYLK